MGRIIISDSSKFETNDVSQEKESKSQLNQSKITQQSNASPKLLSELQKIAQPLTDPLANLRGTAGIESMNKLSEFMRGAGGQSKLIQEGIEIPGSSLSVPGVQDFPEDKVAGSDFLIKGGFTQRDVAQFIGNEISDPRTLLSLFVPGAKTTSPAILRKEASKLTKKANKISAEILQPKTKDLAKSISNGRPNKAVQEFTSIVESSKNFGDLINKTKSTIGDLFSRRNQYLKDNNFKVTSSYTDDLANKIKTLRAENIASPQELKAMEGVLKQERTFVRGSRGFNRVSAQARKEALQDRTRTLLNKREQGTLTQSESAIMQARDSIRNGLKNSIEGDDDFIREINSRYSGLSEANELLSRQAANAEKSVPQSFFKKILTSITPSIEWTAAGVARHAAGQADNLAKSTSSIVSLKNRARMFKSMSKNPRTSLLNNKRAVSKTLKIQSKTDLLSNFEI